MDFHRFLCFTEGALTKNGPSRHLPEVPTKELPHQLMQVLSFLQLETCRSGAGALGLAPSWF